MFTVSQISIAVSCVSIVLGFYVIVKQIFINREFDRYCKQRDEEWKERFRQLRQGTSKSN
jgi:hypothetical protein